MAIALAGLAMLGASAWAALDPERGGLAVLLAALAAVAAGFAWLEGGPTSTRTSRWSPRSAASPRPGASSSRPSRASSRSPSSSSCRGSRSAHGADSPSGRWRRSPPTSSSARGVDAVADARVGRLRGRGRPCRAAPARPRSAGGRLLSPRPRLQRGDGRLGVVQLLPPHLAGVHAADVARLPVRPRPRDRQRRPGARNRS